MCELETVSYNKRKKKSNLSLKLFGNSLQRVDGLADVILKLLQWEYI